MGPFCILFEEPYIIYTLHEKAHLLKYKLFVIGQLLRKNVGLGTIAARKISNLIMNSRFNLC